MVATLKSRAFIITRRTHVGKASRARMAELEASLARSQAQQEKLLDTNQNLNAVLAEVREGHACMHYMYIVCTYKVFV